jgi:hypothetical protein
MRLKEFQREFPALPIDGSGPFAVVLCGYVQRFHDLTVAKKTKAEPCWIFCKGVTNHRARIIEAEPMPEVPIKLAMYRD